MDKALTFLQGKKTYIVAFVTAAIVFAQVMGVVIPEWIFPLLGAAGITTLRSAITTK